MGVEAAGLEPALSQEAGAKTKVQNVKQYQCLARISLPDTIYGAMLPVWGGGLVRLQRQSCTLSALFE